jgi:O-methyltransferase
MPVLAVSIDEVRRNFQRYGMLDNQLKFLVGWFKDTLPRAPISRLSILRLDGDMYQSTMESLDNLYGRLSCNGYVIVDDYALPGCRQAVHDFRARHNILEPILKTEDGVAGFWKKTVDRL